MQHVYLSFGAVYSTPLSLFFLPHTHTHTHSQGSSVDSGHHVESWQKEQKWQPGKFLWCLRESVSGSRALVWSSGWRRLKRANLGGCLFFFFFYLQSRLQSTSLSCRAALQGRLLMTNKDGRKHSVKQQQSGITSCPLPTLPKPTHQKGGSDGLGSVTTTPGPGAREREKRPAGGGRNKRFPSLAVRPLCVEGDLHVSCEAAAARQLSSPGFLSDKYKC